MNLIPHIIQGHLPRSLLIVTTLCCIGISIYCLQTGYTIIFQNLFYIPIILACIFYSLRGFFFSFVLAFIYFGLMMVYSQDTTILLQAGVRVVLFIGIAGVITFLAISGRKSEDNLRTLTDFQENIIINARVWLMVLDQKGTIHLWNTAAEEISGYRSDEVIGKNDVWKLIYPEKKYRREITETITRIIENKACLENFETSIRSKNGDVKVISWNTKSLNDGEKNRSNFIAIGVDVTDRQMVEEALQEQTNFLQILIDTLPVPIFIKNKDGMYTGCNIAFCQILGRPRDQIIGKTVYDTWPKDMADVYFEADTSLFSSPHIQQYETSMRYADGSWHSVLFYKAPLFDDTNQVTGLVGAVLDITERKHSEEALRESNQKLRLLTSLTRHDILNQVSAVQLLIEIALETEDLDKVYDYISRAYEVGEHIEETIGFTREYENFGTVSSGWHNLSTIIRYAKNEVSLAGVTIANEIPGDLEIYADPIIRKVFSTLIENSVRHGEGVKTIRFSCIEQEHTLIITGIDDGVGVPEGEKEYIFDHGYGKHTGIGLFLVREILSITGLSIRECGISGEGARFEILVPEGKFRITEIEGS